MKIDVNVEEIDKQLRYHFPEIPAPGPRDIIAVAEEAGEFAGAYNKSSGASRNLISQEDFEDEWADVVITTLLTGYRFFGESAQAIIARKMGVILTRGWRNRSEETA